MTSTSPTQLIAARTLLAWTRPDVAARLNRKLKLVTDAEKGTNGQENAARLRALYEAAGVEFLPGGQVQMRAGGMGPK